jgi:uncharacterized protein
MIMTKDPLSISTRSRKSSLYFRDHVHVLPGRSLVAIFDAVSFELAYVGKRWLPLLAAIEKKEDIYVQLENPDVRAFVAALVREGLLTADVSAEDRLALLRKSILPKPMRVLDIIPTFACNLACSYCYQHCENSATEQWRGVFLDIAEAETIVETFLDQRTSPDCASCVPSEICFIGGEPLLHISLIHSLVNRAREHAIGQHRHLSLTIVTNGTLVTPEIAKFCSDHDVFVIVSLDGRKEVNDRARMTYSHGGSFDKARRGYDLLRNAGCRVGICQTVGKHNIATYVDEVLYLLDTLHPDDLCSNSCLHALPGQSNPFRVEPSAFSVQLAALFVKCRELRPFGNLPEQIVRRFKPFLTRTPMLHYCGAQSEKIVISPNGRASLCEAFAFLNTETSTWQECLANQQAVSKDRAFWSRQSPVNVPECRKCALILQCGAGCRYDGYVRGGTLDAIDGYRCEQDNALFHWFVLEFLPSWCNMAPNDSEPIAVLTDDKRKAFRKALSSHDDCVAWR